MADPTPSQTVGPYLALGLPWTDGPVADPDGVRIFGRVLDGAGEPIPDALVETWYHDPPAFARSATDDDGHWSVQVPAAPYLAVSRPRARAPAPPHDARLSRSGAGRRGLGERPGRPA